MARTYKRDALGRFAGGGGGGGRPKARSVSKGANRLTRDNAGRITSVGGTGATARGGRLRTAGGNLRAAQTARIKGGGGRLRRPIDKEGRAKPARIANRSAVDQAHRDKVAKQFKKLDKATRRAYAASRYGKQAVSENRAYGSKSQRAIQSTAKQRRSYVSDTVLGQLLTNRQVYGRKALTKQERADLVASVQRSAQGLRARQSVTRYGPRMSDGGNPQMARLKTSRGRSLLLVPKA